MDELAGIIGPGGTPAEVRNMIHWMLEDDLGMKPHELYLGREAKISKEAETRLKKSAGRLALGEPIQHVLGRAWFRGRPFRVSPEVLIPRPETEELVEWMLNVLPDQALRVLDLGTGSGCIALSLALERPLWEVTGIDISKNAIEVASHNAQNLGAKADLFTEDMVNPVRLKGPWDVIVSNPPYIPWSRASSLETRVTDFEPALALFVTDEDPIRFYRAICALAQTRLAPLGQVFVEIDDDFAQSIIQLFPPQIFSSPELRFDLHGKPRFIRSQKAPEPFSD